MKDIDKLIKEALSEEESEVLKSLEEESVLDMLTANFKGKLGWISIYALVMTMVFFGLAIYCAIMFFEAEAVKDLIMWSVGFMFCTITVSLLKMWQWMQMNNNSVLREVKRLELQVGWLLSKIEQQD